MEQIHDFGWALEELKRGNKLCRMGWNGKGMFAVYSPGHKDLESDKFWSLPLKEHAGKVGGTMTVRPSCRILDTINFRYTGRRLVCGRIKIFSYGLTE